MMTHLQEPEVRLETSGTRPNGHGGFSRLKNSILKNKKTRIIQYCIWGKAIVVLLVPDPIRSDSKLDSTDSLTC